MKILILPVYKTNSVKIIFTLFKTNEKEIKVESRKVKSGKLVVNEQKN